MSDILTNPFLADTISVYGKLLEETAKNKFYIDTINNITSSLESMSISEEKKSEMLVSLNSNLAVSTISKTMDQATIICDKASKINLENTLLQKQIDSEAKTIEFKTAQIQSMNIEDGIKQAQNVKDLAIKDKQAQRLDKEILLLDAQEDEMQESILDRQQKRPVEVANLTKQGTLIDGQVAKMTEDKLYVIAQKISMLDQVEHNKSIKAMDSMADMIGTLGAGGLVPNAEMFKVYFTLNKNLTTVALPTSYTVSKAT